MQFSAIYNEVADIRFNRSSAKIAQIKKWINDREAEVWESAPWPIKDSDTSLTVSSGTATIALPGNFFRWPEQGFQIFDENGDELAYMEEGDFYALYQPAVATSSKGHPEAWTIHTDVSGSVASPRIRLGPTPNANYTFRLRGWTLPIKQTAADTWGLGTLSADTDIPWWPEDYHYMLVDGAVAKGKRLESDPSWQGDEEAFQKALLRLQNLLIPTDRRIVEEWGEVWCP